ELLRRGQRAACDRQGADSNRRDTGAPAESVRRRVRRGPPRGAPARSPDRSAVATRYRARQTSPHYNSGARDATSRDWSRSMSKRAAPKLQPPGNVTVSSAPGIVEVLPGYKGPRKAKDLSFALPPRIWKPGR